MKNINEAIRIEFVERAGILPIPFTKFTQKSPRLLPNQLPAINERRPDLWLFISLHIHSSHDGLFTADFGWSTLKRFPEVRIRALNPPLAKGRYFSRDEFLDRLGAFSPNGSDIWWEVRCELDHGSGKLTWNYHELQSRMQEMMRYITINVLPYFETVERYKAMGSTEEL